MNVIQIAEICHEANRAYCHTIGDGSQKPWNEAAEWQRESAVKGVEFAIANPNAGPSAQHESWMKEKQESGWRYGAVKSPERKEHPCLVEYHFLPESQRLKDSLFIAIVRALQPKAGT